MTKYYYDKEWLKKVQAEICPECGNSLILKGGQKTACKACDFEFKGNPQGIAYEIKNIIITNKDKLSKICPDCFDIVSNAIYEPHENEKVCSCGLVLEGPPQCIRDGFWVNYPQGIRLQWDINISIEEIPMNMPDRTYKEFKTGHASKYIKKVQMSYRVS